MEKKDFKFDKMAESYDEDFEGKLSKKFYDLIADNVTLTEGCRVLDAGCGTGTILKKLNDRCGIDGYGIDTEEKMLIEARKKCPHMSIELCSCESTPFENDCFDVITACMAYHHFPDKEGFAKEAARILKVGGRLYIADPLFVLPVRKIVNTALSIHKVTGEFYKPDEIAAAFIPYGFTLSDVIRDAYAQLVIMKKKGI